MKYIALLILLSVILAWGTASADTPCDCETPTPEPVPTYILGIGTRATPEPVTVWLPIVRMDGGMFPVGQH